MRFDKFENLLKESSYILKKIPIKEKRFMDISGYPHYENVCSNILGFYLNPVEEHKLDKLVICSLINVINNKCKKINIDCNNIPNNLSVQRE